jgi:hypothetical protein
MEPPQLNRRWECDICEGLEAMSPGIDVTLQDRDRCRRSIRSSKFYINERIKAYRGHLKVACRPQD